MQTGLTPLQQRILVGIWRGFLPRQIANHIGCSRNYVNTVERDMLKRLQDSRMGLNYVRPYRFCNQQRGSRMTIVSALETLAVDWPEIRREANMRRAGGFWQRNETCLDALAYEVKRAYRRAMVRAHPDRGHDAEQAQALNAAYHFVKRQLAQRGVEI